MQSMTKIDAIGRKILQELSRNGRISNLELADRVGLSPSACLRRVHALERSGVIKGYRAVIDRAKLGLTFLAHLTVGERQSDVQGKRASVRVDSCGRRLLKRNKIGKRSTARDRNCL